MSNDIEAQETKKLKLASTPNDLVFNTDTDQSDYPIFVDPLSAVRTLLPHVGLDRPAPPRRPFPGQGRRPEA